MPNVIRRVIDAIRGKAHNPAILAGRQWSGTAFIDAYKKFRDPTKNEILAELKNATWTCASINASLCASYAPRLFAWMVQGQPAPKCATENIPPSLQRHLKRKYLSKLAIQLPAKVRRSVKVEEVVDHKILDLFESPNDVHSGFDLWELTTFYQETIGSCYWHIERDTFGVPEAIWILPAQNMTPKRKPESKKITDFYEYQIGNKKVEYPAEKIIHFMYPDPRDPYTNGLSPLRACMEIAGIDSEYLAWKRSLWENRAVPDVVVSPDEVIGEEERDRLEAQWNQKFRKGGAGKALVAESGLKVSLLAHNMGDLTTLAEHGASKEDICNAFHVPLSYFTSNTNLANLEAAESQHLNLAISPRLIRRDQKLNHQFMPMWDTGGTLFLGSEDPTGVDAAYDTVWLDIHMKYGLNTINEVRAEKGLEPVPWGDVPWMPLSMAPTDFPTPDRIPAEADRNDFTRRSGRNTNAFQRCRQRNFDRNVGTWPTLPARIDPDQTGIADKPPQPYPAPKDTVAEEQ